MPPNLAGGSAAPSGDVHSGAKRINLTSSKGLLDPPCSASTRDSKSCACLYRGFPSKLHHAVPHWAEDGALFHIRIAVDRQQEQRPLTEPTLAQSILDSVKFYQANQRWYITLFVLLPDHLHALLSFAIDHSMSRVVGDWKHFHARNNRVIWQEGYLSPLNPKENAGCRSCDSSSGILVDVQQRLNCALSVVSSSLDFFRCRGLNGISADFSAGLAVDLCKPNFQSCDRKWIEFLLRKEVIQPQVPLRLPCYDFIPVTAHSVDGCFPCGLARRLRLQATSMM